VLKPLRERRGAFKHFYNLFGWVGIYLCMNPLGAAFSVLTWQNSAKLLSSLYWYPHIVCVILILVAKMIPTKREQRKKPIAEEEKMD